jgi:hypothetical protein
MATPKRRIALELGPQTTADHCGDCERRAGTLCDIYGRIERVRIGEDEVTGVRHARCIAAELAGKGEA